MGHQHRPQMEATPDLICSYAALILADSDKDVTADNISAIADAAKCPVPGYLAQLFEKVNTLNAVSEMVANAGKVGSGAPGGAGPATGGATGGSAPAAAKEESEEEEDMAPATDLFGGDGDDY